MSMRITEDEEAKLIFELLSRNVESPLTLISVVLFIFYFFVSEDIHIFCVCVCVIVTSGVKKTTTYKLNIEDCEPLQAVYSHESCPHKIISRAKLLVDSISNFTGPIEEISLILTKNYVKIRSFLMIRRNNASSSEHYKLN
jgi:hypothetical protein